MKNKANVPTLIIGGEVFQNENMLHPEDPEILAKIESELQKEPEAMKKLELPTFNAETPIREKVISIKRQFRKLVRRGRAPIDEATEALRDILAVHQLRGMVAAEIAPELKTLRAE